MLSIKELQNFTEVLATKAGQILLTQQKYSPIVKYKDVQDIATTADIASEKFIIDSIEKNYPSHSIFSEERGEIDKKSEFRWIIDPLDGTKIFVRGLPLYNVSICVENNGKPIAGVIYFPVTSQLFSAGLKGGTSLNGSSIHVSDQIDLAKSFIGFYTPTKNRANINIGEGWKKLKAVSNHCYRLKGENSSNVSLCWLAQGGFESYLNLTNPPHYHDLVTGLFIAKEAGAIIDTENYPLVVCNNKKIYNAIIELL